MVFKRRDKRSVGKTIYESVYPRGGWGRAVSYISHRLRRLPDPPARIARGIAAGVFVSFSPLFGLHFFYAVVVAYILRGNILAALLSTFFGNPLTFPLMAAISIQCGEIILDSETPVPLHRVLGTFSQAFRELWRNLQSVFSGEPAHWHRLEVFFDGVFLPYLVGSLVPGIIAGVAAYGLSRPVIAAYQRRRAHRLFGVPKKGEI